MKYKALWVVFFITVFPAFQAHAHCQIPCGIYGDNLRFTLLEEDILTIDKAMESIRALSAESRPDYHAISRHAVNKEQHASKIQDTVSQYFLAQRVKLPVSESEQEAYTKSLILLHRITIAAMKTKQTVDAEDAGALRHALEEYKHHYHNLHHHEKKQ